jgi:hypothetical protein
MKRNTLIILGLAAAVTLGSCAKKLDEYLVNPNTPSTDKADANLYLNAAQLGYASFFNGASSYGQQLTRKTHMYGPTYRNAYTPQSFDGLWSTAYTSVFKHTDALIPIAAGRAQWVNVAMAKIMRAHVMMTLVDMFGNVPASESNLGVDNTNPAAENGKDVYAKAIALLDEAIADLAKTNASFPGNQDMFFAASNATGVGRWRTTAKLLKLRALVNTRLVDNTVKDKINALSADADVVASLTNTASDFEFKYSSRQANPNSRHPLYNGNYTANSQAGDYINNYFMSTLVQDKGTGDANNDPRTRYFLYRQRTNYALATSETYSCIAQARPAHYPAGMPYCQTLQGYWGRDHGDNSGIPPDGNLRTTVGIYPAGGQFDANQGASVALNVGGQGAGIQPIWQSAFTYFVLAEAALTIGANGTPKTLLENAIRRSMAKVGGFPASIGASTAVVAGFEMTQARIDNYVTKVLARYDAATTDAGRLDVIGKEYWIALWGNGLDSYNLYRRTGRPADMQFTIAPDPGAFARSVFYPSNYVNLNKNATQKNDVNVQVYWDNNPAGFIK